VPEYESVNSEASAASDLESLSGINSSPKIAASSDVRPADNTCSQTDSSKGIVVLATNNADGVRKRDKKAFCFFCNTGQSQVVRHWITKHRREPEVMQLMSLKGVAKRQAMTRLRNLGNHAHNCAVLTAGVGEFVVTYRPKEPTSAHQYVPCETCLGYLTRKELWRHRCPLKKTKTKGRVAEKASLLLPTPSGLMPELNRLISGMLDPDIKLIIRNDVIIKKYAGKLLQSHSWEQRSYIRSQLSLIARFLKEMRKKSCSLSLKGCIDPTLFLDVVQAVKTMCGFHQESRAYETPTSALKVGHILRKCAKLVKTEGILARDKATIENADYFAELCETEWKEEVSSNAHKTLRQRRRNRVDLVPLSEDVTKLHTFLHKELERNVTVLQNADSTDAAKKQSWRELSITVLAQLITFNRRRQGEVSKMKVGDYLHRKKPDTSSDACHALNTVEAGLCKIFTRVEVEGKRGRTVPVLLQQNTEAALQLLHAKRVECGIRTDNQYVFAMPHSDNYFRGCDALREVRERCGAQYPLRLKSTALRRQVATLCQILNLKENELDLLAQYMGHDISVHRNFYRLPDDTMQSAILSKIFLSMEDGSLTTQRGTTLEQLLVQTPTNNLCE